MMCGGVGNSGSPTSSRVTPGISMAMFIIRLMPDSASPNTMDDMDDTSPTSSIAQPMRLPAGQPTDDREGVSRRQCPRGAFLGGDAAAVHGHEHGRMEHLVTFVPRQRLQGRLHGGALGQHKIGHLHAGGASETAPEPEPHRPVSYT